ncbi:fimbria/pilus periplasmic chaperone [Erwinia sp. 198]|uniref:fimbria/pilus periplasmic chaperone n=1 Tax=Erwinia sp. 198 TaxID=2022746 RepID=UPI000F691DF2|nr:fimbria/pilus periplasmic chaperone [Erwinia sp. 198]RRZ91580.1 fimbrial chaperone protein [Erwinia sp. 198]
MMKAAFYQKACGALLCLLSVLPLCALASGGIALNTTRIIYSQEAKQTSVSVRNTADKAAYLVQSWVEDKEGNKTKDFIVTPPLFTSRAKNENILRLMYSGSALPTDRESLYFFNTKAIPSVDRSSLEEKNTLILATITRIKLFVRPTGLKLAPDAAPAALRFKKAGDKLEINNPTPYYLTLTDIKMGSQKLQDIMVAPFSSDSLAMPAGKNGEISFSTINDYGAVTPPQKGVIQ